MAKKIGVVFSNLGTPQAPEPQALGAYLGEFLMDPWVIQLPFFFRWLLVKGLIVPLRKKKSAHKYKKIWTPWGSPLLVETEKAAQALQVELGESYQVVVGMRYGEPSFKSCAEKLKNCDQIIFFPQYPQYAASTRRTGTEHFLQFFPREKVKEIPPYFAHPFFLKAYGDFLKRSLKNISFDRLLMSFHGLPESHIRKEDVLGTHCLQKENCCDEVTKEGLQSCYRAQCYASAQGIAKALGLKQQGYGVSFQSRLGPKKWISPSTEETYGDLVAQGVKRLAVICPGFSVDGLETLEEIAMEGKAQFLKQGGEEFHFIPCLNQAPEWIKACSEMVMEVVSPPFSQTL